MKKHKTNKQTNQLNENRSWIPYRIKSEILKINFFRCERPQTVICYLEGFAECWNKNVSHAFLVYTAFNE